MKPRIKISAYRKAAIRFTLPVLILINCTAATGQLYSLQELILYAQEHSPESMKNSTRRENRYWQYMTFKSRLRPRLVLNSTLPFYQNTSIPVLQDDGSIVYRKVNQAQSFMDLTLEQNIALTGGQIFLSSDLSRIDEFDPKETSYNGSPYYIGFRQPVFGFNDLKWMKQLEPLKYEASIREYTESNELVAFNTVVKYFNQLLEARRDMEKARRESSFNMDLYMSYGTSNITTNIPDIYKNPGPSGTVNVGIMVPILDWGRSRAARKTAEANLKLVEYTVQQETVILEQEVITNCRNLEMLRSFIDYTREADQVAAERYQIARDRYIAGDISLTEYNIAQEEKDLAKQDYITALMDFWTTWYSLRMITLYDFEHNQSLIEN